MPTDIVPNLSGQKTSISLLARGPIEQQALDEKRRQFDLQMDFYKKLFAGWGEQQKGVQSLVDTYNQAFNAAKQEQDLRRQQQLGLLDTTTGQRAADINTQFMNQQSSQLQGLSRLGMANTSAANTIRSGNTRERMSSLNRLADEMQQSKLSVLGQPVKYPEPGITEALITASKPQYSWPSF